MRKAIARLVERESYRSQRGVDCEMLHWRTEDGVDIWDIIPTEMPQVEWKWNALAQALRQNRHEVTLVLKPDWPHQGRGYWMVARYLPAPPRWKRNLARALKATASRFETWAEELQ